MLQKLVVAALTAAAVLSAGAALAQDNVCKPQVEAALSQYGLKMSDLQNVQWFTDRWPHRGGTGSVEEYRFYAEPASCSDGNIAIELWNNCAIQEMYTVGDCKIKGIPNHWW